MSDSLSEKLAFRRELPRHLRELGALVGRPIAEAELLTREETEALRARANTAAQKARARFEIPFDEKSAPRFREFVRRLGDANPADVYVWTPASNTCGLLRPVPLMEFDLAFPFDVNPEGIIVVMTADLRDRLILDYSSADGGQQILEVEVSGDHWGSVAY